MPWHKRGVPPRGEGNFVHFDDASPVPKFIINTGKWRPTKLLGYGKISGKWGHIEASVLEMRIDLFLDLDR